MFSLSFSKHDSVCAVAFLYLLVCCWGTALSQNESIRPKNVKIASPNAAALGKVADIPVNYHTGIPNIDIPIYTVHEGPLQLPISLAYHASGLRVSEQSSWTGAGFSLNAGGMITRSVRGAPDEVLNGNGAPAPISYLNNKGYYDYMFWESSGGYVPPIVPAGPSGSEQTLAYSQFINGRDGEADIFNFNFNGYSGKFYFRPDNSVTLAPQQDIKVTPLRCPSGNTNCSYDLYGWIVTTPDGVRYHFGKDLAAAGSYNTTDNVVPLEHTTSYSATSGLSYSKTASSWFLNKIESPDQKFSISLVYSAEDYAYYTTSLFPQPSTGTALDGIDLVKNIIQGVRLTAINFSNNGQVSFIPSFVRKDLSGPYTNLYDFDPDSVNVTTAPRSLGEIRISNGAEPGFCQSFTFDYGYFYDQTHPLTGYLAGLAGQFNLHSDKRRLKLKAITEKSCGNGVVKPPYKFTYYDEGSVPRTLSFAQDHWGYYNGQTSNASMLPPISIDNGLTMVSGTYGDRGSKWPDMRAGTLQQVQHPQGGHSRFVFESHSVHIPLTIYDSIFVGQRSANYTQTSGVVNFTLTETTTIKAHINFPYYPNGQGSIHIINTATGVDHGPGASQGLQVFQLAAGNYQFSVQSTSNSYYPIDCTLYKMIQGGYEQLQSVTVGGLRIDSLIYDDASGGMPRIQAFDYVDENGIDQGVLYSRPAYVSVIKNYRFKEHGGIPGSSHYQNTGYSYVNGCINTDGSDFNPTDYLFHVSPNAILPLVTSQGNHFGYNYVRVTEPDGGYTAYQFMPGENPYSDVCLRVIDRDACTDFLPNYPPAPEPFKPNRGELIGKSVYNASGLLLYKETYSNTYEYEPVGVNGFIVRSVTGLYLTTEYEWKSARKTKSTMRTYTYNVATPTAVPVYKKTETFFESTRHTQPTRVVVSDGDGKVLNEVRNTFVADLAVPSCPDLPAGLATLDANLIAALAARQATYNAGACVAGDSPCKLENWLRYTYYAALDKKSYVEDRMALMNSYKSCMTGTTPGWSWSSASPELQALVKLKNRNQLSAIVERTQWRDGMFLAAESITYQDFGNDTLSFFPGKLDVIRVTAPLPPENFIPVSLQATGVTRDGKYKPESAYTYKDGNPVEAKEKNGVKTAYLWGYNNSEIIAQAVHASSSQIYHDSFETAGGTAGNSKTGRRYRNSGTYTIPFTPPADGATYKMSYWYWSSNQWNFSGELPFSATISNGTKIDEIRVYPAGALMTTYTYDLLVGLSTQADPNGMVTHYNYDSLGRLTGVSDDDENLVKTYQYHYKDQN